jgi:hypothetical protein
VTVTVREAPGARLASVQLTSSTRASRSAAESTSVQVPAEELTAVACRPAGRSSLIVTLSASEAPSFVTLIFKVLPLDPATTSSASAVKSEPNSLSIDRRTSSSTVFVSLAESFVEMGSFVVLETDAVLVADPASVVAGTV